MEPSADVTASRTPTGGRTRIGDRTRIGGRQLPETITTSTEADQRFMAWSS
jgi:hypothetical protein